MKILLPVAALAVAFGAAAQNAPSHATGGHADAVASSSAKAFLAQFDPEQRGAVSWAQFEQFRRARYDATDSNHDVVVSRQEYIDEYLQRFDARLAEARAGHLRQTDTRFRALDRDKDGHVSRAEFDAAGERTWAAHERSQDATRETAAASNRDPLKMPTSHTANGMLELYDRNGDGVVDRAEFDAARAATFAGTDADNDGRLDLDEYTREFAGRLDAQRGKVRAASERQAGVRFNALDTDKDGRMTFAEYQVSGRRLFDRADTDGDGIVDARDPEPTAR